MMSRIVVAAILSATFHCIAPAQVEIKQTKNAVAVAIDGKPFTVLHFGVDRNKPYLHPLLAASGKPVTRGFPVDPQPGESTGQPHQLGVWMGHEKLNDVDYWEVEPGYVRQRKLGKVVFKDLTKAESLSNRGEVAFVADWVDPDGVAVVTETRTMLFRGGPGGSRIVDIDFRMRPNQRIRISDHADGILGLRLGSPFEEQNGGVVRNFTGAKGADQVIGRRSPWLDYSATVGGEKVGVTIMGHPSNYNFPTRLKVRAFASIFVSAFGEMEFFHESPFRIPIPKTAKDAGLDLERGEEMRFRYRIWIHGPDVNLDEAWREFAGT